MGLVKCRDIVTGELIEDKVLFAEQLAKIYPNVVPALLYSIVKTIGYCMVDEGVDGSRLRGQGETLEDFEEVLAKMYAIRDKNISLPEDLDKISNCYKHFITIMREPDFKTMSQYLRFYGPRINHGIETEEDLAEVVRAARDIFDIMRAATEASLHGELSLEEQKTFKHSKEPSRQLAYKTHTKRKLETINQHWQNIYGENTADEGENHEDPVMKKGPGLKI
jgi:hypothetical protein